MSFLAAAGKKTTDIRTFLKEVGGGSTIKYKPEKGVKHYVHIPYLNVPVQDEEGNEVIQKQVVAISGNVHEWHTPDGKYRAMVCLKDVVRKAEDGTLLNDGSCPLCERISDAWDIYRYRLEMEEKTCGKTGEDLKKHIDGIKKVFADERKMKEAKPYIYMLVVLYKTDSKDQPIMGANNLPEYELKIMKLSASRVEKLQQQVENSGDELAGSEMIFEYPNEDDPRLVVSQSTTAPVFPNARFITKYPGLAQAIANDVAKFTWEGIEKAFLEWSGMTTAEAKKVVDELFGKWDKYKRELAVNPNARYLEYEGANKAQQPPLIPGGDAGTKPLPGGIPDVNKIFGSGKPVSI